MTKTPLALLFVLMIAARSSGAVVGWLNDGTGCFPDAAPQVKWSATERVIWSTPLTQSGNASPVLAGGRLFLAADPDTLICLDLDGKILWQQKVSYKDCPAADQEKLAGDMNLPATHASNGHGSNTVVSDGESVWVALGSGIVASYTLDGKRQWARFLEKTVHKWGHSSSPLLVDGRIIIQYLDMFALDARTGADAWRSKTPDKNWGTPGIVNVGKRSYLLTDSGALVNAADGVVAGNTGMKLEFGSPRVSGEVAYCVSNDAAAAFSFADDNGKVKITPLWRTKVAKDRYYATPQVHDGLVYVMNRGGILTVLDAKTGQTKYVQNTKLKGTTYTTPVLCGKVLILASDDGVALVIEPGPVYKELARNTIEPFRSTPLCVGPRMYLRTSAGRGQGKLFCIGE